MIVGWTTSSGTAYCPRHKRGEDLRPIFSTDEGWRDVVCDVPHGLRKDGARKFVRLERCKRLHGSSTPLG